MRFAAEDELLRSGAARAMRSPVFGVLYIDGAMKYRLFMEFFEEEGSPEKVKPS